MRTCDISVSQINLRKKNSRSSFKAASRKSKNHWFLPLGYWGGCPPKVSETPAFALALRVFFPRATKRLSSNPRFSQGEKDGERPFHRLGMFEGRRRRSYNLRLVCLKRKERPPPKKNSNIPIEFGRKSWQFHWLLPDGISPCNHFLSQWDMWWCWLWPQVSNAQNPYNLWLNDHSSDWFIEILMINGLLEFPYNWKVQSIYTANHQGFGHCSSGSSSPQNASPSFIIRLLCGHRNLARGASNGWNATGWNPNHPKRTQSEDFELRSPRKTGRFCCSLVTSWNPKANHL